MANRFTNLSQATFNPLSMQEIMAVPMALQAKHDALIATDDATQLLKAKVGSNDQAAVDKELNALKERSAAQAQDIIDNGYSTSAKGKFGKLKKDVTNSFGADGNIGYAMQQQAAQQSYLKDFDDNGWGNSARNYANRLVGGFSSFNEDGTRNSFAGEQVDKYVDGTPILRAAIKDVLPTMSAAGRALFLSQGPEALAEAAAIPGSGVTGKDYTTVMAAMKNATEGNPELMASLRQQSKFTGEEGWSDFGHMEVVSREENGVIITDYDWKEGSSTHAQKMNSLGILASTQDTSIAGRMQTDLENLNAAEKALAEKTKRENILITDHTVDMSNTYSHAKTQTSIENQNNIIRNTRNTLEDIIKSAKQNAQGQDGNPPTDADREAAVEQAKSTREYTDALSGINTASNRVDNLNRTKNAYLERSRRNFSEKTKKNLEIQDRIANEDPKEIFNSMAANGDISEQDLKTAQVMDDLVKEFPNWATRKRSSGGPRGQFEFAGLGSEESWTSNVAELYEKRGMSPDNAMLQAQEDLKFEKMIDAVHDETRSVTGDNVMFDGNQPDFINDFYKYKIYKASDLGTPRVTGKGLISGGLHSTGVTAGGTGYGTTNYYKNYVNAMDRDTDETVSAHMREVGASDDNRDSYDYDVITGAEGSKVEEITKLLNVNTIKGTEPITSYEVVNQGNGSSIFITPDYLEDLVGDPIPPDESGKAQPGVNLGYKISFSITGADGYDENGNRAILMNVSGASGQTREVLVLANQDQVRVMDRVIEYLPEQKAKEMTANRKWIGQITKANIYEDKESGVINIPGLRVPKAALEAMKENGDTQSEIDEAIKSAGNLTFKKLPKRKGQTTNYWSLQDYKGRILTIGNKNQFKSKKEMSLGIDAYVNNLMNKNNGVQ